MLLDYEFLLMAVDGGYFKGGIRFHRNLTLDTLKFLAFEHTVEKIHQLGGKAVTMSDTSGFIFDPEGIDAEKIEFVKQLKNVKRGRIHEHADKYGVEFYGVGALGEYHAILPFLFKKNCIGISLVHQNPADKKKWNKISANRIYFYERGWRINAVLNDY